MYRYFLDIVKYMHLIPKLVSYLMRRCKKYFIKGKNKTGMPIITTTIQHFCAHISQSNLRGERYTKYINYKGRGEIFGIWFEHITGESRSIH